MTFFLLATMTVAGGGILQEVDAVNEGEPVFDAGLAAAWPHGASLPIVGAMGIDMGFGSFCFSLRNDVGLKWLT